ncbi:amidase [Mycobacterium heidelbergense]|uniref:amidase n=1 Tax=Mycobacterium heidelbergense TaxID=53376 RepID=UPI003CE6ED4D
MKLADIAFAGAADHNRMLADGVITSPALIELYLERIARLNPELRAFTAVFDDTARAEAAAAQRMLDAGETRPLLGVPVAIKDNVDVAGAYTTFGTRAHGAAKERDAEVVRRLRTAGAVIIGKTACPELCMWPFTETVTFGATRNPWNKTRTPGGSSGGAAVATVAGMASFALGSDAGGSVRIPATWCGVFGIKPQRGRVPLSPNDEGWYGLNVNGVLTRTVEDAALFLDITTTADAPGGGFVGALTQTPPRLRIALSTKVPPFVFSRLGMAQRAAVDQAGALLQRLGHQVIRRDPGYPLSTITGSFIPRYLRGIHDDVTALPHRDRLEARTRTMAKLGGLLSDRRMSAVRAREQAITGRLQRIFDDVDVLVTPGTASGPPRVGKYQGRGAITTLALASRHVPFQQAFNVTGQPAAVIPWGFDEDGLPLSIQLVGRPFDEATLLSLSAQFEAVRPWARRRPRWS